MTSNTQLLRWRVSFFSSLRQQFYPIWILQQQQLRCELATPLTSSRTSNRSPTTTFWIHILLARMRQQQFSQLFCKPLWCSHCSCFMKEAWVRYQRSEVIWPLWSSVYFMTCWTGDHFAHHLFLFLLLPLIVKLLNYQTFYNHLESKKPSKRVLPTDFRFSFPVHKWDGSRGNPSSPLQCSYHRTFSGSFYLLYYVRLTLRSGVDSL